MTFTCLPILATAASIFPNQQPYSHVRSNLHNDDIFQLGDINYLSSTSSPVFSASARLDPAIVPFTHIAVRTPTITRNDLEHAISEFAREDDVFNENFLHGLIITTSIGSSLETSATDYLASIGTLIQCFNEVDENITAVNAYELSTYLPEGPLLARITHESISFSKVFRLYADTYRTFLHGLYESDGTHKQVDLFDPEWSYPFIPVPSRLYSRGSPKPLAGYRVGVKDIYDIQGLRTTRGSRAYSKFAKPSTKTAPSIQRIIDLGGVVVGKQKTAQFASGARPWQFGEIYYPQNPRGDGFLSCSASSSGAGCSIAAYVWLDFAIGSDTGQSVRQPAAFSGTYGNRPSQGLMSLENVMPIAYSTDTAGVFARDPHKWVEFAKYWYDPSLIQDPSLNGLPELKIRDTKDFPKRILYPIDILPLKNPAAEEILQNFLSKLSKTLDMKIENVNLTEAIESSTKSPFSAILDNLNLLWIYDLENEVARPLLEQYAPAFPPLDFPFRITFKNLKNYSQEQFQDSLKFRREATDNWESGFLFSSNESCSESMFIYDIGGGGLPTFREPGLNEYAGATVPPGPGTADATSIVCSFFGCADYTIPIGQVTYFSHVTHEEVMMPVTVNMVVRRGCDFMLFNLVEELANKGILSAVLPGQNAFES